MMREDVPFVKGIGKNPCFLQSLSSPGMQVGRFQPYSRPGSQKRDGAGGGGGVALRLPICTEPVLVASRVERPKRPFLSLLPRPLRCQVGQRRQAGRRAAVP